MKKRKSARREIRSRKKDKIAVEALDNQEDGCGQPSRQEAPPVNQQPGLLKKHLPDSSSAWEDWEEKRISFGKKSTSWKHGAPKNSKALENSRKICGKI